MEVWICNRRHQPHLLVSCFFYARRRFTIAGLLILGIAGVNLLENYRGPVGGLLLIIALVFPVIPERFGRLRIIPSQGGAVRVADSLDARPGSSLDCRQAR